MTTSCAHYVVKDSWLEREDGRRGDRKDVVALLVGCDKVVMLEDGEWVIAITSNRSSDLHLLISVVIISAPLLHLRS
jgi:hypothetical protein